MVPNNGAEDDADELFRGVNQARGCEQKNDPHFAWGTFFWNTFIPIRERKSDSIL